MTPYQITKATGAKSWTYSPDGFCKVEEFETGEAYLHNPLFGYPIRLSNWNTKAGNENDHLRQAWQNKLNESKTRVSN